MPEEITLSVNGQSVRMPPGATVAAAIATASAYCRRSVTGERRSVLCGMGVCFECRVEIDGRPHQRSCQIVCSPGMRVSTEGQSG
ncbi:MAG TPA: 2Fe-2S iron-sulfur cluster-binding protein [Terriglobales bacterium]|jgi:D-hydroxyproline dehydrogenase subunit gamma|nr:2Fe-2S iron-sulfur cluster-binding protein [Terriglobales bacterium]